MHGDDPLRPFRQRRRTYGTLIEDDLVVDLVIDLVGENPQSVAICHFHQLRHFLQAENHAQRIGGTVDEDESRSVRYQRGDLFEFGPVSKSGRSGYLTARTDEIRQDIS